MIRYIRDLSGDEKTVFQDSALYRLMSGDFYFNTPSLAYNKAYFGDSFEDYSLVVFQKGQPVLGFYAFSDSDQLKFYHWPVTVYYIPDDADAVNGAYKELFIRLNDWKRAGKINRLLFYRDKYFAAELYENISSVIPQHQAIVDLALSDDQIKMNIRKSYKSLVNWGEKNLQTVIVDHASPKKEIFDSFRQFHIQVSGRQTRSDESWDLQFEMIRSRSAFLVMCYLEEKPAAGALVLHGNETAFYGVGVNDRSLMAENKPVGHYPVFTAILHAKRSGLKRFHLNKIDRKTGEDKLNNIAKFKQGFTSTLETVLVYEAAL